MNSGAPCVVRRIRCHLVWLAPRACLFLLAAGRRSAPTWRCSLSDMPLAVPPQVIAIGGAMQTRARARVE
jgi:hypothetical protein